MNVFEKISKNPAYISFHDDTLEMLKEIIKEYIRQENDETENSTEYAYVALEPNLLKNEELTTEFLKQSSKDEYDAVAYLFYDIVHKFQSVPLMI